MLLNYTYITQIIYFYHSILNNKQHHLLTHKQNTEGNDAIYRNSITGETVKVNYKYTTDNNYIKQTQNLCENMNNINIDTNIINDTWKNYSKIKNDKRLFLGFSDAAPNVVLSPDPFPTKRLYLVLFDPRSRNYYSTAGDVFSNTKWPEYNELINLVDTGGYVLKNDVPLRKRIKLGIIYTHSQLDENVIQDQQQKSFLNSLNIRCNLHFSYHDDTDRKDTISTLKKQKTFIINLNDQETIMNTSTIAGLVEFISKRYIEVLPYMVDELNFL